MVPFDTGASAVTVGPLSTRICRYGELEGNTRGAMEVGRPTGWGTGSVIMMPCVGVMGTEVEDPFPVKTG